VLCAVDLDHQPQLDTRKISDERTDWVLTAELVSGKAPIAKKPPEGALRIGLVRAKVPGVVVRHAASLAG
jgi:hypothetical protein